MSLIKHNTFFKVISIILIISFIVMDITWANPEIGKTQTTTLAVPSMFDNNMGVTNVLLSELSPMERAGLLFSLQDIGDYFFRVSDNVAKDRENYVADVMRRELKVKGLDIAPGIDLDSIRFEDGVVYIQYKDQQLYQIAKKGTFQAKKLEGEIFPSQNYVIKVISKNSKLPVNSQTAKKEAPVVNEPARDKEVHQTVQSKKETSSSKISKVGGLWSKIKPTVRKIGMVGLFLALIVSIRNVFVSPDIITKFIPVLVESGFLVLGMIVISYCMYKMSMKKTEEKRTVFSEIISLIGLTGTFLLLISLSSFLFHNGHIFFLCDSLFCFCWNKDLFARIINFCRVGFI